MFDRECVGRVQWKLCDEWVGVWHTRSFCGRTVLRQCSPRTHSVPKRTQLNHCRKQVTSLCHQSFLLIHGTKGEVDCSTRATPHAVLCRSTATIDTVPSEPRCRSPRRPRQSRHLRLSLTCVIGLACLLNTIQQKLRLSFNLIQCFQKDVNKLIK